MPASGPIKRRDLIAYLKRLGFSGPYSGGKHQYLVKEQLRLYLPKSVLRIIKLKANLWRD